MNIRCNKWSNKIGLIIKIIQKQEMLAAQSIKCQFCQEVASKVCIHQKCDQFPFICTTDCLKSMKISQLTHNHNNDKLLKALPIGMFDENLSGLFDSWVKVHTQSARQQIQLVKQKLDDIFKQYSKELQERAELIFSKQASQILQQLKDVSSNKSITGRKLDLILTNNKVYLNYDETQKLRQQFSSYFNNLIKGIESIFDDFRIIFQNIGRVQYLIKIQEESQKESVLIEQSNTQTNKNAFKQAKQAYKSKDIKKALKLLAEASKLDKNNYLIYSMIGDCHKKQIKLMSSKKNYKKSIQCNPKDDKSYFKIGQIQQIKKKYKEAIDYFNKAIQIDQKHNYFYEKGRSEQCLGLYLDAILSVSRALQIDCKNDQYYYLRGKCYRLTQNYQKSILDLTTAIQNSQVPKHEYYNQRALAFRSSHQQQRADQDFNMSRHLECLQRREQKQDRNKNKKRR